VGEPAKSHQRVVPTVAWPVGPTLIEGKQCGRGARHDASRFVL